jgi:hypothetical protein
MLLRFVSMETVRERRNDKPTDTALPRLLRSGVGLPTGTLTADKFNERAHTAAMFLHVSNAYDMVWTTGHIYKLHKTGMRDSSHEFHGFRTRK